MNISLSKIKNKLQNLTSLTKINSHKHWQILLWISFFIIICLVIFGFGVLLNIKNDKIFQTNPTPKETPSLIKEKLLKNVTESFNQKSLKEMEIKNNYPIKKDPSVL